MSYPATIANEDSNATWNSFTLTKTTDVLSGHVIYTFIKANGTTLTDGRIKVNTSTNVWSDHDQPSNTNLPYEVSETNGVCTVSGLPSYPKLYVFTKPTFGPTVTSISNDKVVVPSDIIYNTDFTLLKNGSAYANSNISVTLGTFDPADTPRFYDYTLTLDGSGSYRRTIDSKSYEAFEYDNSWLSSPSSGKSTSSSRILNVLATIPQNRAITNGGSALTSTFSDNGRVLTHTYNATIASVATNIDIIFLVEQRLVNNVSEICGFFYEIRTVNSIRTAWFSSPLYIIGNQATMSYTQNISGVATTFSVSDWIYSDEPEGDGYVAPVTTTSNGGGKPDRYPLIMTNLFNRNRSLYSIGMTHKDTWDLFL